MYGCHFDVILFDNTFLFTHLVPSLNKFIRFRDIFSTSKVSIETIYFSDIAEGPVDDIVYGNDKHTAHDVMETVSVPHAMQVHYAFDDIYVFTALSIHTEMRPLEYFLTV